MVEASQWYSLISVGSSSLALLAAAYVVRKIPNRRAGDTFVLAMVFFVLAGTFAYLLRTSTLDYYGTNSGPLAIARLFYFFHMLAVGFTASFIGQYFLGFEIMRRRLVNLFLQVSLLIVAIGVTTQVTELENEYGGIGVVVEDTWARGSLALFATLFMSTALAVLVRTLLRNKDPIVRKQAILMTAGVVIHGTGAESYAYLRIFTDLYPPPYLTITAFAMAAREINGLPAHYGAAGPEGTTALTSVVGDDFRYRRTSRNANAAPTTAMPRQPAISRKAARTMRKPMAPATKAKRCRAHLAGSSEVRRTRSMTAARTAAPSRIVMLGMIPKDGPPP